MKKITYNKNMIKRLVEMSYKNHNGHLASSLSALPIMVGIYQNLNIDTDVFILSKGHACLALFVILEQLGYNSDFCKVHPDIDIENGISCTTGSLGHGLPMAVGMAWAKKIQKEEGTIYVLLGDGECMEGTTWESLLLIERYQFSNLSIHIDHNKYQALGKLVSNPIDKILDAFPNLLITVHKYPKGYGVNLFNNHPEWHVRHLTEQEYNITMKELS